MSEAMREKDAADYDLERFVEMFDQALTSDDPRVKNALRQLLMMVILTDTEDHEGQARSKHGPLRRMQEDIRDSWHWIRKLEQEIENLKKQIVSTHGLGGYRSQGWPKDFDSGVDVKYSNTATGAKAAGQSVDPKEYWNAIQSGMHISPHEIRDLNIKINNGLLPKDKK